MNLFEINATQTPQKDAVEWLLSDTGTNSSCSDPYFVERYALVTIDYSCPRKDGKQLRNSKAHCDWEGVQCSANGNGIINLDLSASLRTGTIATEIGLLSEMTVFKACE